MVFTSINFLIFFPLLAVLSYIIPAKYRWLVLLAASYFFYINIKPVYALLTAGITLSTFLFTRWMDKTAVDEKKKRLMIANIILILLPLFFFKYFSVINHEIFALLSKYHIRYPLPEISFLLPVGISFYTFMAIGYTVDVYNEEVKSEKNIGIVALFIAFFPLVLSGPIERAKNLFHQFNTPQKINYSWIVKGLKLMLWGYFMKLVVADRLAIYINAVYNNLPQHNGNSLLFASLLYPFQVYADLGGYSLIAIGTAKVLGIDVIMNFKRPFFATTMSEFWRRWHISLITWLTDYVYTPLSFSFRKLKVWGIIIALMITFFISGIWHGASLTFLFWGLMQGVFLSIEALTNKSRSAFEKKYHLAKNVVYIFSCICLTFVLFSASQIFGRAVTINDALNVYYKIFFERGTLYIDNTTVTYSFIGLIILMLKDFADEYYPNKFLLFENSNIVVRYISYLFVLFMILLIGVLDGGQFIYFQF
jgi:D-alanyl-lipoteichoic acid acyltransferase DltB (MBOAT superfamily)